MEEVHFSWRGCISVGGRAFQLEGVHFSWRKCISVGGRAFQLEGVHFSWRACISVGGGAFQLEGVHFSWRGCISVGGGAFQLEGVHFNWRGCILTGRCISVGGDFQLKGCILINAFLIGGYVKWSECASHERNTFQVGELMFQQAWVWVHQVWWACAHCRHCHPCKLLVYNYSLPFSCARDKGVHSII